MSTPPLAFPCFATLFPSFRRAELIVNSFILFALWPRQETELSPLRTLVPQAYVSPALLCFFSLLCSPLTHLQPQDAIDLTDNDIQVLGNFPLTPRLRTLLLARNRIAAIQPDLANALPSLTCLALASNQLAELADLDPLARLVRLTHLVLLDNPVTKREKYRYWVIWRCPTVRFLDFQKVKDAERSKAEELFGTHTLPTELARKVAPFPPSPFQYPLNH